MEARAYVQEKDLVDQVNEALAELRMNKAELALRMSVSRSMMSQYLNRKYRSDATELEEALRGWLREVHPGTEPAENAAEMVGRSAPCKRWTVMNPRLCIGDRYLPLMPGRSDPRDHHRAQRIWGRPSA